MKKVSILTPIYNVEKFIGRCVKSLFEQTYSNIEYVFVNDCTKDSSIEILNSVLKDYPERREQVKIIQHKHNRGVAAARNTAVDNSTGDYLMYVDSDDYIENNTVELLVKESEARHADIVISDFFITTRKREYSVSDYFIDDPKEFLKTFLVRKVDASLCGKLYRSTFYKNAGAAFIEGLNYGEDYLVLIKLLSSAKILSKISRPLYHYIQYNSTSSTNNITIKSIDDIVKINNIIQEMFGSMDEFKTVVNISILRNKLGLIKMAKPSLYKFIVPLYQDIEKKYSRYLNIGDRILIILMYLNIPYLIYIYCKLGVMLKSIQ